MQAIDENASSLGMSALCAALGVPRSSAYRHRAPAAAPRPRPSPARALSQEERQDVLAVLHSDRFADRAPAEVAHTLLEEDGHYLCSVRTMYRILNENQAVRERRNQLRHPNYAKPECVATGPNQVWSWDITKLKGPAKFVYYYLFVILDIFSRYAVAWMVAEHENAELAKRIIREACEKQGVEPGTLVLHNDRGSPMKAQTTTQLVAALGIEHSFSRPQVSNDNPFSESQFKTLKYHPGFPSRFGGIDDALAYCRSFFPWYNDQHRHSGLAYLTPGQVHHGRADDILAQRHQTMLGAYAEHPERFVHGPPKPHALPAVVWINPPSEKLKDIDSGVAVPMTPTPKEQSQKDRAAAPTNQRQSPTSPDPLPQSVGAEDGPQLELQTTLPTHPSTPCHDAGQPRVGV